MSVNPHLYLYFPSQSRILSLINLGGFSFRNLLFHWSTSASVFSVSPKYFMLLIKAWHCVIKISKWNPNQLLCPPCPPVQVSPWGEVHSCHWKPTPTSILRWSRVCPAKNFKLQPYNWIHHQNQTLAVFSSLHVSLPIRTWHKMSCKEKLKKCHRPLSRALILFSADVNSSSHFKQNSIWGILLWNTNHILKSAILL